MSIEKQYKPEALIDNDGLVVLFHSNGHENVLQKTGTVIQSDGHYPIGYTTNWYMGELETNPLWHPFKGTITMNFA